MFSLLAEAVTAPSLVDQLKQEIGLLIVGIVLYAGQEIRLRFMKRHTNSESEETLTKLVQELSSLRGFVEKTFAAQNAETSRLTALVETMSVRLKVWQILSKDCVFEGDSLANFTLVSEPLCTILHLSETAARGKGWLLAVESSKRNLVWEKWEESVSNGLPYDEVIPILGRDRTVKHYRFFALPQLHPDTKKVILYLGTVELVKTEPSSHIEL